MRPGDHHGPGRHGHKGDHHKHAGAQTFRRGRAIAFLESLNIKRMTLLQQLEQPELQEIHPIIRGELKAIDMVRNEFIAMFELYELNESDDGSTGNWGGGSGEGSADGSGEGSNDGSADRDDQSNGWSPSGPPETEG